MPRLLLVDDAPQSARILARMLRDDGYSVQLATDGAAAVTHVTRGTPPPELLITAIRLPQVDGVTVAELARARIPELPVVFITRYPHLIPPERWTERVAVHIKPLDYAALQADVQRLLGRASLGLHSEPQT